jgi:hypothetical protein
MLIKYIIILQKILRTQYYVINSILYCTVARFYTMDL